MKLMIKKYHFWLLLRGETPYSISILKLVWLSSYYKFQHDWTNFSKTWTDHQHLFYDFRTVVLWSCATSPFFSSLPWCWFSLASSCCVDDSPVCNYRMGTGWSPQWFLIVQSGYNYQDSLCFPVLFELKQPFWNIPQITPSDPFLDSQVTLWLGLQALLKAFTNTQDITVDRCQDMSTN